MELVTVEKRAGGKGCGGIGCDVCSRFSAANKEGRARSRDAGVRAPVGVVDFVYSYLCSRNKGDMKNKVYEYRAIGLFRILCVH